MLLADLEQIAAPYLSTEAPTTATEAVIIELEDITHMETPGSEESA